MEDRNFGERDRRFFDMEQNVHFFHDTRGKGRPQIVLVGNGLERSKGQPGWEELVDMLTVSDSIPMEKEEREDVPFPLLYELLASHYPGSGTALCGGYQRRGKAFA